MSVLASLVLATMLLGLAPALAVEPDKPLAVGKRAPDFTLTDHQGKPFRLSDVLAKRRYVVLAFYVKVFTPG